MAAHGEARSGMAKGRKGEREGRRVGSKRTSKKRSPQVAALPVRLDGSGCLRVLLVTSRDTGRWVVPKGWPMDRLDPWEAAAVEALEEAGAEGHIATDPLGTFDYGKRLEGGKTLPCEVTLYPMRVTKLRRSWKEDGERRRRWFRPRAAAKRVDEPGLSGILRRLDRGDKGTGKAGNKAGNKGGNRALRAIA